MLADEYTLVDGGWEISSKAEFIRYPTAPRFSLES